MLELGSNLNFPQFSTFLTFWISRAKQCYCFDEIFDSRAEKSYIKEIKAESIR